MCEQNSTVSSEIYSEFNYMTNLPPKISGNVISKFPFTLPSKLETIKFDQDNDLDIERPAKKAIIIEHSTKSNLMLVGLQVWRGAFLLADYLIYLGLKGELKGKAIMELGAGTGITSFIASIYAGKVICTDIANDEIMRLIRLNADYNKEFLNSEFKIMPLDFTNTRWNEELSKSINEVDFFIAADVIYDDDLTAAFLNTLQKILNNDKGKTFFMALEKRYVFTLDALDSVAPCFETFLTMLKEAQMKSCGFKWTVEMVDLSFPKYFVYDRVKELILMKIVSKPL